MCWLVDINLTFYGIRKPCKASPKLLEIFLQHWRELFHCKAYDEKTTEYWIKICGESFKQRLTTVSVRIIDGTGCLVLFGKNELSSVQQLSNMMSIMMHDLSYTSDFN